MQMPCQRQWRSCVQDWSGSGLQQILGGTVKCSRCTISTQHTDSALGLCSALTPICCLVLGQGPARRVWYAGSWNVWVRSTGNWTA